MAWGCQHARALLMLALLLMVAVACTEDPRPSIAPSAVGSSEPSPTNLVAAPPIVAAECEATAQGVGYPVPCPTRLLAGTRPIGGDLSAGARCRMKIIGPASCARSWRGWVVGSSGVGNQHLVIVASPRPVHDYDRLVNGPRLVSGRVRTTGRLGHGQWLARPMGETVPPATNEGSAFMGHIVLGVGTLTRGLTNGTRGFHDVSPGTKESDLELLRGIRLVPP